MFGDKKQCPLCKKFHLNKKKMKKRQRALQAWNQEYNFKQRRLVLAEQLDKIYSERSFPKSIYELIVEFESGQHKRNR
eukprot:UN12111